MKFDTEIILKMLNKSAGEIPWSLEVAEQVVLQSLNKVDVMQALTPARLAQFYNYCLKVGADPTLKQIVLTGYVAKNTGKSTFSEVTTVQFMLSVAAGDASYAGTAQSYWLHADRVWYDYPPLTDQDPRPLAARAGAIRVVDHVPYTTLCTVTMNAYALDYSPMWSGKMSSFMLEKCALAAALRRAFPQRLQAMYIREEMQQAGAPAGEADQDTLDTEKLIGSLVEAGTSVVVTTSTTTEASAASAAPAVIVSTPAAPKPAAPKPAAPAAHKPAAPAAIDKTTIGAWLEKEVVPLLAMPDGKSRKDALNAVWQAVPATEKMARWPAYDALTKGTATTVDAALGFLK